LRGNDDRLLVVVGYVLMLLLLAPSGVADKKFIRPCSVHNVSSALEYARKLRAYAEDAKDDLKIIMRVYFEKPRSKYN
jgi:3-deoxy-7-phosphoheptulonate synthase